MRRYSRIAGSFAVVVSVVLHFVVPQWAQAQRAQSVVIGSLVDDETEKPVSYAHILLDEADLTAVTDEDGSFVLRDVPAGLFTIRAFRLGYERLTSVVRVPEQDTLNLILRVSSVPLEYRGVVVQAAGEEPAGAQEAEIQLEGRRLRQRLGVTIAETVAGEPGITMRSMGPAPARPVLRGLGGERLLVLEDGSRTGDLSATSSDHALAVDPMTARRIEVIRGPAALAFGSNGLGGVVNVIREYIPSTQPDKPEAGVAFQGQSVNASYAAGISGTVPAGSRFALKADASFRKAGDVSTPAGTLANTHISTVSGALGGAYVRPRGSAGFGGSYYESNYGIPGGFVGAHPQGVNVRISRSRFEFQAAAIEPVPWIPRLQARATYARYHHREYEANGNLGVEYGLLSYEGSLTARLGRAGFFSGGGVGIWGEYRDYAAGGFSFTPAATELTLAGYAYEEVDLGPVTARGGVRYDYRRVTPTPDFPSESAESKPPRSFGGLSASTTLVWHPTQSLQIAGTTMFSLRMPGIEELYSEGPHLAAYAFEVGNVGLGSERGMGVEVSARYQSRIFIGSVALYRNEIRGYIIPLNTGETNHRVFLPIYRYSGARAAMLGGEARAEVRLPWDFSVEIAGSHVRGTLTDLDQPIPWTPPAHGRLSLRYRPGRFAIAVSLQSAAAQERVGPFETETSGYAVVGVAAQYHLARGNLLHTFDLGIQNAGNVAYRDHLSRVKSIMPEPGRNVKLLYRAYF